MSAAKLRDWHRRGHDQHSAFAEPLFVAPEKGDFRFKLGSPAERIGFQEIDVSAVGSRKK